MPNLYGDILSDIAAQVTGSVGLGGSANIGEHVAMFEAIHGSAPDIAGKDMANPSGLLLGAVQMLAHINDPRSATRVYNAWARTLEDGYHTGDIFREGASKKRVGTRDFAKAVIDRLGSVPSQIPPARFEQALPRETAHSLEKTHTSSPTRWTAPPQEKILHGVDIFLQWKAPGGPDALSERLRKAAAPVEKTMALKLITNRGVKVWPNGFSET